MSYGAWAHRALHDNVANQADAVELDAIINGVSGVESVPDEERIAGDDSQLDDTDLHGVPSRDKILDDRFGKIHEEIDRRRALLGSAYPFTNDKHKLTYKQSASGIYEFCLRLSQMQPRNGAAFLQAVQQFERMVGKLIARHLGRGSVWLRTGATREPSLPKRWDDLGKFIEQVTSEWAWCPRDHIDNDDIAFAKDEGLDVLVWRRWPDQRPGNIFAIAQCAAGDDFWDKTKELEQSLLGRWFNPPGLCHSLRMFAVPRHIPSDKVMARLSEEAGFVLDRARLVLIAETKHYQISGIAPTTA